MSDRLIYGIHAVNAQLTFNYQNIAHIFIIKKCNLNIRLRELKVLANSKNIKIEMIDDISFTQLLSKYGLFTKNIVHQNIIAICSDKIKLYGERDLFFLLRRNSKSLFILVLDCIEDPHNFGACIRTAEAIGVNFIIFPKRNCFSCVDNALIYKISCGSLQNISLVCVSNLNRALNILKKYGVWLVGLSNNAKNCIYNLDLTMSLALIVGNEFQGLRFSTYKSCDYLVNLPICGNVNSLNVSVAAGIGMYEIYRQRKYI